MKIFNFKFSIKGRNYKSKLIYIFVGALIGTLSIVNSSYIIRQLTKKELNEIQLWSHSMTLASSIVPNQGGSEFDSFNNRQFNKLLNDIIHNNTIPSILTDSNLKVLKSTNIDRDVLDSPRKLKNLLEYMARTNPPIEVDGGRYYLFFGESTLLKILKIFPYFQFLMVACFMFMVFISFRSSKQDEQKRVWIGMAKETAHQLGTPTSSLLGWLEYLKENDVPEFVIEEMSKDITRLLKVVDRFSKIGSETILSPKNINEIVGAAYVYFQSRIPKNVTLTYNQNISEPLQAMVNDALFEWVIENLMKNALDALQGKGTIEVLTYQDAKWIYIDVIDSGKGIAKSNFKTVFSPGFTTKTRGWGLGLSLSHRIIEEYHKGKIMVAESEIDKGTTMRVMLKKL